jgi:hypothetical protein
MQTAVQCCFAGTAIRITGIPLRLIGCIMPSEVLTQWGSPFGRVSGLCRFQLHTAPARHKIATLRLTKWFHRHMQASTTSLWLYFPQPTQRVHLLLELGRQAGQVLRDEAVCEYLGWQRAAACDCLQPLHPVGKQHKRASGEAKHTAFPQRS